MFQLSAIKAIYRKKREGRKTMDNKTVEMIEARTVVVRRNRFDEEGACSLTF